MRLTRRSGPGTYSLHLTSSEQAYRAPAPAHVLTYRVSLGATLATKAPGLSRSRPIFNIALSACGRIYSNFAGLAHLAPERFGEAQSRFLSVRPGESVVWWGERGASSCGSWALEDLAAAASQGTPAVVR